MRRRSDLADALILGGLLAVAIGWEIVERVDRRLFGMDGWCCR